VWFQILDGIADWGAFTACDGNNVIQFFGLRNQGIGYLLRQDKSDMVCEKVKEKQPIWYGSKFAFKG
jgi:hypothetical protein